MTPNKTAVSAVWSWAGLPKPIEPPRGGRVHRIPDTPIRPVQPRGPKAAGSSWGNQHTANKYCLLCGRKTQYSVQVRVKKGDSSRNHKCCLDCQYHVCRDYSRKELLERVKAAVLAKEVTT